MNASEDTQERRAWVTLLTRPSYLAGAIILAHTLRKYSSRYPLIVLYTDSLPQECVDAIVSEDCDQGNVIVQKVDQLVPRQEVHITAERFKDTWTKLRVFDLVEYDKLVFLDADIMIMGPMDPMFDIELPGRDWLGAAHACVCNVDKDPWAPHDWIPENCPTSSQTHPIALQGGPPITPASPPHYHLMNSGVLLFCPSPDLRDRVKHFLDTTPLLSTFQFPDQNFLDEFFRNKWLSLAWQWNATKTKHYWHQNVWRDDEVRALHYIVDKPWDKRIGPDGIAGYKQRDGVTHGWWWDEYGKWEDDRRKHGDDEALRIVNKYVAPPLQ